MYATPLLAAALAMAFVDAAPAPQDDGGVTNDSGTKTVTDGGFVHNIYSGKISKRSPNKRSLEKRVESDYVSSCGSTWVPVNDYQSGGRSWIGYESAVTAFCLHMTSDYDGNPTVIGRYHLRKGRSAWPRADLTNISAIGPRTGTSDTISVDSSGNQIGLDGGKSVGIDASPGHIECM